MLGIYSIAFFMANAAREIMKKLAGSVFYPMLSEVFRENPEKIKSVYYRLRLRVDFLTMTAAGIRLDVSSAVGFNCLCWLQYGGSLLNGSR